MRKLLPIIIAVVALPISGCSCNGVVQDVIGPIAEEFGKALGKELAKIAYQQQLGPYILGSIVGECSTGTMGGLDGMVMDLAFRQLFIEQLSKDDLEMEHLELPLILETVPPDRAIVYYEEIEQP